MNPQTVKALVASHLPTTYDPLLLTFDPTHATQGPQNLYRIGNDYGTDLFVDLTSGHVISIDPEHRIPDRFLNSSIPLLSQFIVAHEQYCTDVQTARDEVAELAVVSRFRDELAAIDPPALCNPENWWASVIEQAIHGS